MGTFRVHVCQCQHLDQLRIFCCLPCSLDHGLCFFAYLVAFDCALDTAGDNVAEVLDSLIFGRGVLSCVLAESYITDQSPWTCEACFCTPLGGSVAVLPSASWQVFLPGILSLLQRNGLWPFSFRVSTEPLEHGRIRTPSSFFPAVGSSWNLCSAVQRWLTLEPPPRRVRCRNSRGLARSPRVDLPLPLLPPFLGRLLSSQPHQQPRTLSLSPALALDMFVTATAAITGCVTPQLCLLIWVSNILI